jgi:hypothetical protein
MSGGESWLLNITGGSICEYILNLALMYQNADY